MLCGISMEHGGSEGHLQGIFLHPRLTLCKRVTCGYVAQGRREADQNLSQGILIFQKYSRVYLGYFLSLSDHFATSFAPTISDTSQLFFVINPSSLSPSFSTAWGRTVEIVWQSWPSGFRGGAATRPPLPTTGVAGRSALSSQFTASSGRLDAVAATGQACRYLAPRRRTPMTVATVHGTTYRGTRSPWDQSDQRRLRCQVVVTHTGAFLIEGNPAFTPVAPRVRHRATLCETRCIVPTHVTNTGDTTRPCHYPFLPTAKLAP